MIFLQKIKEYLEKYSDHRLYGEWLVSHSLKTYKDDAWRKFYVFDICVSDKYLPYDVYKPMLDEFDLDYIPAMGIINNPTYESLIKLLDRTGEFLVKDGAGIGEGLVIKNYDFYNKFGRQIWAKIVANEFKERQYKTIGCPKINAAMIIEERIVNEFCTEEFIEKEYAKIVTEKEGWQSKFIPELLGKVFYEFVKEETWGFVKKYKFPKVDFKVLNRLVIQKIKEIVFDKCGEV